MSVRLVGSDIFHMGKDTFMWIQVTHFAIEAASDDLSLLAALIASDGYVHDYASPFDADHPVTEPAVHGRWWRSSIRADLFERSTGPDAESVIQAWADDQDWTDPGFRQPPEAQGRLQHIYALLRSGALYRLRNPGSEHEHEYGFVTGGMGFHEFVVIDRSNRKAHVVVASDD
jgi:hypothetical protein